MFFLVVPKTAHVNLCKPIHDMNYPISFYPFESGTCGKEGGKLQKIEFFENGKSFLGEIKNIFHSFKVLKF